MPHSHRCACAASPRTSARPDPVRHPGGRCHAPSPGRAGSGRNRATAAGLRLRAELGRGRPLMTAAPSCPSTCARAPAHGSAGRPGRRRSRCRNRASCRSTDGRDEGGSARCCPDRPGQISRAERWRKKWTLTTRPVCSRIVLVICRARASLAFGRSRRGRGTASRRRGRRRAGAGSA